jgi:uncharacterized damage-inducible protein DinB
LESFAESDSQRVILRSAIQKLNSAEEKMSVSNSLLPEFDHEMANTRKTLERVLDDKFDWKPHPKSTAMGGLATHISNIPKWAGYALDQETFDLAPEGKPLPPADLARSRADLLATFDANVANARAAIAGAADSELFSSWSLMSNGKTILTLPKVAVLRSFVMNHLIHHRAQLGVYLRLNDIPVPSIYGPSADEDAF